MLFGSCASRQAPAYGFATRTLASIALVQPVVVCGDGVRRSRTGRACQRPRAPANLNVVLHCVLSGYSPHPPVRSTHSSEVLLWWDQRCAVWAATDIPLRTVVCRSAPVSGAPSSWSRFVSSWDDGRSRHRPAAGGSARRRYPRPSTRPGGGVRACSAVRSSGGVFRVRRSSWPLRYGCSRACQESSNINSWVAVSGAGTPRAERGTKGDVSYRGAWPFAGNGVLRGPTTVRVFGPDVPRAPVDLPWGRNSRTACRVSNRPDGRYDDRRWHA